MASNDLSEQTVSTSLKAAEEKLGQLSRNSIRELSCYVRPPNVCELVLLGVGILLEPSEKKFEWVDSKKMMNNQTTPFVLALCTFDKNNITDDQLARLTTILSKDECQGEHIAKVSSVCHCIYLWLRAVADHANFRRQSTQKQTQ